MATSMTRLALPAASLLKGLGSLPRVFGFPARLNREVGRNVLMYWLFSTTTRPILARNRFFSLIFRFCREKPIDRVAAGDDVVVARACIAMFALPRLALSGAWGGARFADCSSVVFARRRPPNSSMQSLLSPMTNASCCSDGSRGRRLSSPSARSRRCVRSTIRAPTRSSPRCTKVGRANSPLNDRFRRGVGSCTGS